jgi:hypothetical protein
LARLGLRVPDYPPTFVIDRFANVVSELFSVLQNTGVRPGFDGFQRDSSQGGDPHLESQPRKLIRDGLPPRQDDFPQKELRSDEYKMVRLFGQSLNSAYSRIPSR